jgi:hypothetical protein
MLLIEMQIVEVTTAEVVVILDVVVEVVVDKIIHKMRVILSQRAITNNNNNNNHHYNNNNNKVVNQDNKDNVVVMMNFNHETEVMTMKVHIMMIKIRDVHVVVVDISVVVEDVVVVDLEEVVVVDSEETFNKAVHSLAVISKIDQEYSDVDHQWIQKINNKWVYQKMIWDVKVAVVSEVVSVEEITIMKMEDLEDVVEDVVVDVVVDEVLVAEAEVDQEHLDHVET